MHNVPIVSLLLMRNHCSAPAVIIIPLPHQLCHAPLLVVPVVVGLVPHTIFKPRVAAVAVVASLVHHRRIIYRSHWVPSFRVALVLVPQAPPVVSVVSVVAV